MPLPGTYPPLNPSLLLSYDQTLVRAVLVDTSGKIIVSVPSVPLPAGAATADNQTTEITALQLIDDLQKALKTVNTDKVEVEASALPLPAGAATEVKQTQTNSLLNAISWLVNALESHDVDDLLDRKSVV